MPSWQTFAIMPQCSKSSLYSAPVDEYDFLLDIAQILFGAVREVGVNLMADLTDSVIDEDPEGQKCTWSSAFRTHTPLCWSPDASTRIQDGLPGRSSSTQLAQTAPSTEGDRLQDHMEHPVVILEDRNCVSIQGGWPGTPDCLTLRTTRKTVTCREDNNRA